jgi:hypothetical protein
VNVYIQSQKRYDLLTRSKMAKNKWFYLGFKAAGSEARTHYETQDRELCMVSCSFFGLTGNFVTGREQRKKACDVCHSLNERAGLLQGFSDGLGILEMGCKLLVIATRIVKYIVQRRVL